MATYLLSSGEFSRRIRESATLAALETENPRRMSVSAPLGAHDQIARLVLRRYDAALAGPPTDFGGPEARAADRQSNRSDCGPGIVQNAP